MSKLEKVIIVIASLAALTAAFMIFKTARDYKAASDEYDSLRQYASEEVSTTDTAEKVSDIKPIELEEAEERKELKSNENREDFPEMEVDFKALREKNPDTVGWLYVGSCGHGCLHTCQQRSDAVYESADIRVLFFHYFCLY